MDQTPVRHLTPTLTLAATMSAALLLTGCNAVRGVGMDIYEVASHSKAALEDTLGTSYAPAHSPTPDASALSIRDDYDRYRRP